MVVSALALISGCAKLGPSPDYIRDSFVKLSKYYGVSTGCTMPKVVFSSAFITSRCQPNAQKGTKAMACYIPSTQTIYLPSSWDGSSHYEQRLLYHEMDRHIEQACLGRAFFEPEPQSVLDAEKLAPWSTGR